LDGSAAAADGTTFGTLAGASTLARSMLLTARRASLDPDAGEVAVVAVVAVEVAVEVEVEAGGWLKARSIFCRAVASIPVSMTRMTPTVSPQTEPLWVLLVRS